MWIEDSELAETVARMPWVADDVSDEELEVIMESLPRIASEDPELTKLLLTSLWVTDGFNDNEWLAFKELLITVWDHLELTRLLISSPWVAAGASSNEPSMQGIIADLQQIAWADWEMARFAATAPWVVDGVNRGEARVLRLTSSAASRNDLEKGRRLLDLPSAIGDLVDDEHVLYDVAYVGSFSIPAAITLADYLDGRSRDMGKHLVHSFDYLAQVSPEFLTQLVVQPWFADGLDNEESASLVILCRIVEIAPQLYQDLLHSRFIQTKTISLPLAGDVNIYIVQSAHFPPDEDLLTTIGNTARIAESFLGEPFPTTDIILLVTDPEDGFAGRHYGTYMTLVRSLGNVESLPHETAHYYAYDAPRWFVEGFAEFMETYVEDQTGLRNIVDRRLELLQHYCFTDFEMENIRHYMFYLTEGGPSGCSYPFGENFMLAIFESIGEEAMSTALRELYLANEEYLRNPERGQIPDEEAIYNTFLKHTPSDRREAFIDVYRRLHGGAFAFDDIPFDDDYGDKPSDASEIATGGAIEGTLDYVFDFDYFKFQAEEDQKYRIAVNHESLGSSSITLYDPDGLTRGRLKSLTREASGPQIQWVAPSSDEYYFAVQNFGGKTGAYTLTITPVDPIEDDHGDTIATATNISLGEVVQGAVDGDFDYDYFQFQAVEGKTYRVMIELGTIGYYHLHLYAADRVPHDVEYGYWADDVRGGVTHDIIDWMPSSSGTFYLAIDGARGSIGAYTVTITADD